MYQNLAIKSESSELNEQSVKSNIKSISLSKLIVESEQVFRNGNAVEFMHK